MRLNQRIALTYIRTKFKIVSSFSKRKAAEQAFKLFCTPQHRNKKKLPRIFSLSEKLHFEFKGNRIQGYRWNVGAPQKFLILHGFESSVIKFDRYIKPMIQNDYEVLAFDAPAHGRSSGKEITAVLYKELILHINKKYGPIKNFMAHSLGGLAVSLALEEMEHDENFKVVLIAPASETTTAINSFFRFLTLDDKVRYEFDHIIKKISGHYPDWFSISRIAGNIKADVLWLQDKHDDMTPMKDAERVMRKNLPNFRFLISEGLGHRRIYRDNKSHKAIIEFFRQDNSLIDNPGD